MDIDPLLGYTENEKPECERRPYLEETYIRKLWNPKYNQYAMCVCSHEYYRHFDTYEGMRNVGCKYCGCAEFRAGG